MKYYLSILIVLVLAFCVVPCPREAYCNEGRFNSDVSSVYEEQNSKIFSPSSADVVPTKETALPEG